MTTISQVSITLVDLAPKVKRVDAIQSFISQETPIVTITDSDGATGTGYSYTIGTGGPSVIALLRLTLAPALIGKDPDRIEGIWRDLLLSTHATAVGAITSLALATIDTALWDLKCKICVAAIEALRPLVVGLDLDWVREDMGRFWRHITGDSQLRWIGPDKGVIHLATGAVVNAVWDLLAKDAKKPVWQLVGDMSPAEIVKLVDFRYITDALTPDEALEMLQAAETGKAERIKTLKAEGYPCYTTSAGWLGYSDDKLRRLCREAREAGFTHTKFKVGHDLQDDIRRLTIAREELGQDMIIMIDANQVWEVDQRLARHPRRDDAPGVFPKRLVEERVDDHTISGIMKAGLHGGSVIN